MFSTLTPRILLDFNDLYRILRKFIEKVLSRPVVKPTIQGPNLIHPVCYLTSLVVFARNTHNIQNFK